MIKLFLFLLFSCAKKQPLNHKTVHDIFENKVCLETLRKYMKDAGCPQVRYVNLGTEDVMFRCHKSDQDRGEFWDNYIFRISPMTMQYKDADSLKLIQDHTICLDNSIRIEAYSPDHR
jgi:hypothetical protein